MFRLTRTIAAGAAVMTVLAVSSAVAQTGDSTRTSPPTTRERAMDGRGMRPHVGPDGARNDGPKARRSSRGRFDQGAPGRVDGERGRSMRNGGMRKGSMRNHGGRGGGSRAMLRGITLSTEQEKALREQQARHLLATKPLMIEMMSARTDQQLAELNGDQKALDAATGRLTTTRSRLDSLRAQRSPASGLRAVLTPDQQKILDQNLTSPRNARPGRRAPGSRELRGAQPGRQPGGAARPTRPGNETGRPNEGAVDR